MKAILVRREALRPETLVLQRLCHDLSDSEGKILFRKGAPILEADLPALLAAPWETLHLLQLEPGDLDEIAAGERLARAIAGTGVVVQKGAHGKQTLRASYKGLLKIDAATLQGINALPGIAVYTLLTGQVVCGGDVIAYAQITPLALPDKTIEAVERWTQPAGCLLSVAPFFPRSIGILLSEQSDPVARERFLNALKKKLDWFGSTIREIVDLPPDPEVIRVSLVDAVASGATLILIAGSNAMDPLDPFLLALERAGARMERIGIPAHPGTLLWLAGYKGVSLIGLPRCGLFSQTTVFDLILPKLLARGRISPEEIADLGHGGILNRDMMFRFPPYERESAP